MLNFILLDDYKQCFCPFVFVGRNTTRNWSRNCRVPSWHIASSPCFFFPPLICCSSSPLTTTRKKCNIEGLINRVAAVEEPLVRYAKPPELWTIYYGYGFSEHSRDFFLYTGWNGVISRNISPKNQ